MEAIVYEFAGNQNAHTFCHYFHQFPNESKSKVLHCVCVCVCVLKMNDFHLLPIDCDIVKLIRLEMSHKTPVLKLSSTSNGE